MKTRAFGILNIAVMIFYLLRPVIPYIEYFLNKEYIEKHLCVQKDNPDNDCHGKCYLHAQLEKQSENQDANTNDNKNPVPENKIDDHLKTSQPVPEIFRSEKILSYYYPISKQESVISDIFVPPKK